MKAVKSPDWGINPQTPYISFTKTYHYENFICIHFCCYYYFLRKQ